MEKLRAAVIGGEAEPQSVSQEWLSTFNDGGVLTFPTVLGAGNPTSVEGLPAEASTVGSVLKANDAGGERYYIVLKDEIAAITPLVADLLKLATGADAREDIVVSTSDIIDANGGRADTFYQDKGWPQTVLRQANATDAASGEARTTSCSVYKGGIGADKKPELAAWAGTAYPKKVVADSLGAYVSSGSGLLFQEVKVTAAGGGAVYLLTDTGLRYSLPANNDSGAKASGSGSSASAASGASQGDASETDKARTRLGYEDVSNMAIVPQTWATFIPKGPMLDTGSAAQPQSQ
jgi:hypothetical protein